MRHKPLICLWLLTLLMLFACEETTTIFPEPTSPGSIVISLVGQCFGGTSGIVCEDASTTTPAGRIQSVSMTARTAAGSTIASASLPGGCGTAPSLACEIEFPGLAPGTYSVTHTVTPDDGSSVAQVTYRDLIVTG